MSSGLDIYISSQLMCTLKLSSYFTWLQTRSWQISIYLVMTTHVVIKMITFEFLPQKISNKWI